MATTKSMTLDQYRNWERSNKLNDFTAYNPEQLAKATGFTGKAKVQTGIKTEERDGDAAQIPVYGASPELLAHLKNFRFTPTKDGKNAAVDISTADGTRVNTGFRVGDHTGSMMKFMSVAMPLIVGAGMGAGALGMLSGGAAAGGVGAAEGAALGGLDAVASAEAAAGTLTNAGYGAGLSSFGAGEALGGLDAVASAEAGAGALTNAGYTAGMGGGSTLGTTGLNAMRAGELAGYSTSGALPSSAATAGGGGSLFGSLGDAYSALPSAGKNALWNLGTKAVAAGLAGAAGSALAPDGPNSGAINAAATSNAGVAGQFQGLADQQKALFDQYAPVLKDLISKNVAASDLSTQRSNDAWADYNTTWKPVQQKLATDSMNWASPGRLQQQAQEAASGVASQFDSARSQSREQMIRAGMDPSAIAAMEASGRLDEAKATAGAANNARRATEREGMGYVDNAARFGSSIAGLGLSTAQLGQQQQQGATALLGNLSGLANAPGQALNGVVNANNATTNAQLGLFNANRAATNDRNAIIGDVIGAGLGAVGQAGGWKNFINGWTG